MQSLDCLKEVGHSGFGQAGFMHAAALDATVADQKLSYIDRHRAMLTKATIVLKRQACSQMNDRMHTRVGILLVPV
jgi:hypothetical protein